MLEVEEIFKTVTQGVFNNADKNGQLALLETILPTLRRWNIDWGDGTIDMYANRITKMRSMKEKLILLQFGVGSKTVYGTYTKKPCMFYTIAADTAQQFGLPHPDYIIERVTGKQYYLYIINF